MTDTPKQPRLFDDTAQNRRPKVLMHVADAGDDRVQMLCKKCGHREWVPVSAQRRFGNDTRPSVTEVKRGLPCPACNGNEA